MKLNRHITEITFKKLSSVCVAVAVFMLVVCLLLSAGCALFRPEFLGFDCVTKYKLALDPVSKIPNQISGLSFRSAYRVYGYEVKTNGDVLIVLVKISLFKGETGYFSIPLDVGNNINELRFGPEQSLIWQRRESKP